MEVNTILASEIPELTEKYAPNPAYDKAQPTPGMVQQNIVKDCYRWATKNKLKILSLVSFQHGGGGFDLVIVYE